MSSHDSDLAFPYSIGVAAVDITPPVGALLVGYAPRRATAVGHSLRAEALVCRRGDEEAWAIVTCDVLGFTLEQVADIRARVTRRTGLAPDAVMVTAQHTHSGPAVCFGQGQTNEVDDRYVAGLMDRLVELVEQAWHAPVPARFELAQTSAPDLLFNRRVQLPDGSWTNEWEDPEGKNKGYADPSVAILGVRTRGSSRSGAAGTLAGLVVNYGCHPVTLGSGSLDISADYPGYMRDRIEAELPGCTAMFTLSGAANIDPRLACRVGAEYPRNMGESLAGIVLDTLPRLAPVGPGPLSCAIEPWEMVRTRDAPGTIGRHVAKRGETCRTEFQALTAGGLMILGVPGELFSEFTARLQQIRTDYSTIVVSMANDFVGYLPTDEAQRQGAYEPTWAPIHELEQLLLDHAAAAMACASSARG